MSRYKVLITTSGVGSRLGELTEYTNKSLVRVGKKPVLSYIIETYPESIELVITLGHFANHVKEFISLAYPNRKITFVNVDKYQGKGSSLGYSMLKAKKELQCPFIYHACDTITNKFKPTVAYNWVGGFKGDGASSYASFDSIGDNVREIKSKGALDFDYLHIGVVGVRDYKNFWEILSKLHKKKSNEESLNDCQVINAMIRDGSTFKVVEFETWLDTGSVDNLTQARKKIRDNIVNLDKVDESIFLFKNFVIKFFYEQKNILDRVARGKILESLVPKIDSSTKNFYRYKYAKGDLYSRVVTPADFPNFLKWAKKNLWKEKKIISDEDFKKICYNFYYTKTVERVKRFLKKKNIKDKTTIINGEEVPSFEKILKKVDFDWLCDAKQHQFHGDFILDNVIRNSHKRYYLLDWRQNFGGLLECGDMYYDLAKLNHNLTVNHDVINSGLFSTKIYDDVIDCDIMRKENLVACQKVYQRFLIDNGYDLRKVDILTALIWLNMSPLHDHPFDLFLFYFGKLNLWRLVK